MPLLFYWRHDNYVQDLDDGAGYHLNSKRAVLHEVERGDSVWAVTRRPDDAYVLAAELIVHSTTHNRPGYEYGPYRVWGHVGQSRYFALDGQPGCESLIRSLSVKTTADRLYHSFQGPGSVRRLTEKDHRTLAAAADNLPEEPRATLLPEEALETALYRRDRASVTGLVREADHGLSADRRRTITREVPERNRELVQRLQTVYDGHCQICRWDPVGEYGEPLCEGHHIQWLSRGGDDALDNLMLVCPNHHRAIHRCDAPLDWGDLALDFGAHWEEVALDEHLIAE